MESGLTAVRQGELTDRNAGSYPPERRPGWSPGPLPDQFHGLPEAGRLTHEGRTVHPRQSREEVTVMRVEIPVERGVLAEASYSAATSMVKKALHRIIDPAEDCNDERV